MAADIPPAMIVKARPPMVAPALSWTGPYLGINAGAAWLRTDFDAHDALSVPFTESARARNVGFTIGGTAGYNWQLQNFLLGVEGDFNWADVKASGATHYTGGGNNPFTSEISSLATVRARAGFLVTPSLLVYATGGYAAGRIKQSSTDFGGFAADSTRSGWTAGGGGEYRLTPNWTVKAEVLYLDFGKTELQGSSLGAGYGASFSDTTVIARMGANFKF
jgi:outer membrane immunogenic protein